MGASNSPRNAGISHIQMARVLNSPIRWSILAAVFKAEVLPAAALAKSVGVTPSNLSKHLAVLRRAGVLAHWPVTLWRIPGRVRVAGGTALAFGSALILVGGVGGRARRGAAWRGGG